MIPEEPIDLSWLMAIVVLCPDCEGTGTAMIGVCINGTHCEEWTTCPTCQGELYVWL